MYSIRQKIKKEYGVDSNTPIWKIGKLMADHKLKSDDILANSKDKGSNPPREN